MSPRIGLFGGSFDPVHRAHVALAHAALRTLGLDRLCWLPAGQPWQKARTLTDDAHRAAMLELAIAGEPRFFIDTRELARSGPTYTIDTVRELQAERPDVAWTLVIGQDQYAGFHTWQGWPELLERVELAVAARPGAVLQVDAAVAAVPHRIVRLPPMAISATDIRARVAAQRRYAHLVPPGVAAYIDRNGLYRPHGPALPAGQQKG